MSVRSLLVSTGATSHPWLFKLKQLKESIRSCYFYLWGLFSFCETESHTTQADHKVVENDPELLALLLLLHLPNTRVTVLDHFAWLKVHKIKNSVPWPY